MDTHYRKVKIKNLILTTLGALILMTACVDKGGNNTGSASDIDKEISSEKLEECDNCRGKGTVSVQCEECEGTGYMFSDCDECDGYGIVRCSYCNNTGKEECTYCSGTGGERCLSCSGSGQKECIFCWGKGRKECFMCNGTGWSSSSGTSCLSCSGDGYENCTMCWGDGYEDCSSCNGTGIKECTFCAGGKATKNARCAWDVAVVSVTNATVTARHVKSVLNARAMELSPRHAHNARGQESRKNKNACPF